MLDNISQNKAEVKRRLKHLLFVIAFFLVFLILYYVLYTYFPKYCLKCVFYEVTSLKCPGCGITRMLSSFLNFKINKGLQYNYFLGITLPFVGIMILYNCYVYVLGKKFNKYFNCVCIGYLILLVLWGLLRNVFFI